MNQFREKNFDELNLNFGNVDLASNLNKFLIDSIKNNDDNSTNITLVKLNSLTVNEEPYSHFLRDTFKIDSRSILKRLHMFLLQYPEIYTVDYEAGTVRLTKDKERIRLKDTIVHRCNDFIVLCLSLQPQYLLPIEDVYKYVIYASEDVRTYLRDLEYFKHFIRCENSFYVEDDHFCLANVKRKLEKRKIDISKMESTRIDEKLIDRINFVYNIRMGKRIMNHIIRNTQLIAIDTEGVHLGSIDGQMTLVQIAFLDKKLENLEQITIVDNIQIFFFDVLKCPDLVKECIKPILINENIIKILHDAKNDFYAFERYYGIHEIYNVFDTSKTYFKLTGSNTTGLHTMYEEATSLVGQNLKPKMRQFYQQNDSIWEDRPLSDFLKFYAAFDVLCILSIYLHLDKKYDFSKLDKNDLYKKSYANLFDKVKVYNENCVKIEDDSLDNKQMKSKKKNKKKTGEGDEKGPLSEKITGDELEKIRKKFEILEKLARGEAKEVNREPVSRM